MTTYKLTVNLDATLAVQNQNGSFNYFKPSVGAEITTDETDDLKILAGKFEDLYNEVIGPNFNSVVSEFILNSKEDEPEDKEKNTCGCNNESCDCNKSLEIQVIGDVGPFKPLNNTVIDESSIVHYDSKTLLPIDVPKEEWE